MATWADMATGRSLPGGVTPSYPDDPITRKLGGPTYPAPTPRDPHYDKGGQPILPGGDRDFPTPINPVNPDGPVPRPPLAPVDPTPPPGPDGPDPGRPADPQMPKGSPPTDPLAPSPLPGNDSFSKGQVRPDQMPNGIFNPTQNSYGSFDPFAGAGKSGGPSGGAGGLSPYPRGTASQWDPLGIGQSNYGGGPVGQNPASAQNVYGMTGVNAATGYDGPARYGVVGGQGGYGLGMVGPEYSGPVFNDPQVALRAMRRQERRMNKPIQAQSLGTPATPAATSGGTNVNQQKGGQPAAQPTTTPAAQPTQQGAKGGQPTTLAQPVGGVPQRWGVQPGAESNDEYQARAAQWVNTLQTSYGHKLYDSPQGKFFESSAVAGAPQGVYKQQGTNALHTYRNGQFVPWQMGQPVGTERPGNEIMQGQGYSGTFFDGSGNRLDPQVVRGRLENYHRSLGNIR